MFHEIMLVLGVIQCVLSFTLLYLIYTPIRLEKKRSQRILAHHRRQGGKG